MPTRTPLLSLAVFLVASCQALIYTVESPSDNMSDKQQPPELGGIQWQRDLPAAYAASKQSGKPVLLLFQEVPGCVTCENFGRVVLNHPLLAEAADTIFIPVLVYNNRKGTDADTLRTFNEPAWNNPVVRYLNYEQKDLTPRQQNDYSLGGTARKMVATLQAAKRPVPQYLSALADEYDRTDLKNATFAMHCFWTGEAKLGSINGVNNVNAAFAHGQEVVVVTYDPALVTYDKLIASAQSMHCATTVFAHDDKQLTTATSHVGERAVRLTDKVKPAKPSDHLYSLRATSFGYLPLTALQAIKINAAIAHKDTDQVVSWLSPRQRALHERIVTALKAAPKCLGELTAPSNPNQLADYLTQLEARLSATP